MRARGRGITFQFCCKSLGDEWRQFMHLRIRANLERYRIFRQHVHHCNAAVGRVGRDHRSRYIPERAGDDGLRREFAAVVILRPAGAKLISGLDLIQRAGFGFVEIYRVRRVATNICRRRYMNHDRFSG